MKDKKAIQSTINVLRARLNQIDDETYYEVEEKQNIKSKLENQIDDLTQQLELIDAKKIDVVNHVELKNHQD